MALIAFYVGGALACCAGGILLGGMYPSIPAVRIDQVHHGDEEYHTQNYAPWFREWGPHGDWRASRVYMPMLKQFAKDVNVSEKSRHEYALGGVVKSRSRLVEFREWPTSWHRFLEYVTGTDYTVVKMTAVWEDDDRFVMDVHKDREEHMRRLVEKLNKERAARDKRG